MENDVIEVQCPNCGYDVEVNLVTTLQVNDQALEELFKGTLNIASCSQCQMSFISDAPLIFRDSEQSYYIYYLSNEDGHEPETLLAMMGETIRKSDLLEDDFPNFRLTLSRQNFLEKIALHIGELDDKIIEYLKFQMFYSENDIDRDVHELFYNFSSSNKDILYFTVFDKLEKKALNEINLPRSVYEQVEELADEGDKVDLDVIFPTYLVQECFMKKQ